MTWDLPELRRIDARQIDVFRTQGFLILERVLEARQVDALRGSFPRLFAGDFDTGVYPDEWYWREGMSLPDVTRHMANAWKADLTVAKLALAADLGRAVAAVAGWSGARLGQDTIWWKPPGTKPIAHHQDSSFLDILDPTGTVTCWVALDDTKRGAGTLEYVPGSHLWPRTPMPKQFHATDDFRAQSRAAAAAAGVDWPEPITIEVPAGSIVLHIGDIWHGSGPNESSDTMRRAVGVHFIPPESRFSDRPGGYIYRRYQRTGDPAMDESFFPITWRDGGAATPWIAGYCETGRR